MRYTCWSEVLWTAVVFMSRKKHEARSHKFPPVVECRRSLTTQCRTACIPTAPLNTTTSRRLNPAIHPSCNYRSFHFQQTRGRIVLDRAMKWLMACVFNQNCFTIFKARSLKWKVFLAVCLNNWWSVCWAESTPPSVEQRSQWGSSGGRQKFTCLLQSIADVERERDKYSFCGISMRRLSSESLGWKCFLFAIGIIIVQHLIIIIIKL